MTLALAAALALALTAWLALLAYLALGVRHMRFLPRAAGRAAVDGEALPSISAVCVVKDEERLVGATVETLLRVGAPLDEVVVVDDRSTDRTTEILRAIAAREPRLRVVRVDALPDGWQGRVHALERGAEAVTGDYVLTADAEIDLDSGLARDVARVLRDERLDHLAIVPRLRDKPFLLDVLLTTAQVFYVVSQEPWKTIETRPVRSVRGVGAFNLVRRDALHRTGGFAPLRMEIIDDVGLAQQIAAGGGRSLLLHAGPDGPRLTWYRSVREMAERLEKTIVGAFTDYRWSRAVLVVASAWSALLAPLAALGTVVLAAGAGASTLADVAASALLAWAFATLAWAAWVAPRLGRSRAVLAALPLGIAGMGVILARASLLCARRGGIAWKGTLYPLAALRAQRRTRFHV